MAEDLEAIDRAHQQAVSRPFVRVVADGPTSQTARVELVEPGCADDGSDRVVEIPHVRAATFRLEAGRLNTADLELLVVDGDVTADVVRLRELAVPPPRRPVLSVSLLSPQRRWFGLRRSRLLVQVRKPAGDGYIVDAVALAWTRSSRPFTLEGVVEDA